MTHMKWPKLQYFYETHIIFGGLVDQIFEEKYPHHHDSQYFFFVLFLIILSTHSVANMAFSA